MNPKIQTDTPAVFRSGEYMYSVPSTGEGVLGSASPVDDRYRKVVEALSPYIGRMDLDLDTFCVT
ncbi:hypothetical protein O9992_23860 [Vibrio lentus]|nr:hypothetical protein [Vibrio lentus]